MENILDNLAEDTAPRNADEFYLGMYLAALLDAMDQDVNEFDPDVFDSLLENGAVALEYWRDKYGEEIIAAGKAARQGLGNGE
jgi:hypothetical protein